MLPQILPGEIDLASGKLSAPVVLPCHYARTRTIDTCGPDGKHWEPAEIGFGCRDG